LQLGYLSLLVLCALIELYFLLLNSNSNMCIDLSHLPIAFIVFLEYNRTLIHMIDDVGHVNTFVIGAELICMLYFIFIWLPILVLFVILKGTCTGTTLDIPRT
jgi:hypothetical protein